MNDIDRLAEMFTKFPGIGRRQARRFVYYLLRSRAHFINDFTHTIEHLKTTTALCPVSFHFFVKSRPDQVHSPFVENPTRDKTTLLLVEKDMDLENIEKTGLFKGQYFVLGGLLPLSPKKTNHFMRSSEFIQRIQTDPHIKEVIFGLSLNNEGEHTRLDLQTKISGLAEEKGITLSTLGRGLSTGSELEYIDDETFNFALKNRK